MMAPGIPQVAEKYGITNPTVIALTLSIFLLSFAIGVRSEMLVRMYTYLIFNPSRSSWPHCRKCMDGLGYVAGFKSSVYFLTG